MKRRAATRGVRLCMILVVAMLLPLNATEPTQARNEENPRDFFGVVGRDPWYDYNTNPAEYPNDVNRRFLGNMMADMAAMGAGWVRIEIHAEYDQETGPGWIDYSKHDWYIRELAPKHGVKVLGVLGSGILADLDETYQFKHINDPADAEGRNSYSRAFVKRAREIADHYGDAVAAYEIMNEPNANQVLHWETNGMVKEVDPDIYGQIAVDIYQTVKPAHPNVQFIVGAMLHDSESGTDEHFEWLQEVYQSDAVRDYVQTYGRHPWDGVSLHPYWLDAQGVVTEVKELRQLQRVFGDQTGIWITEVGKDATPAKWTDAGIMEPTASEREQAKFLGEVYTRLRDETPYVKRVFWFKYEDFGANQYAGWGLVRLRDAAFRYGPNATPWPRKPAYRVYQSLARPVNLPTAPVEPPPDEGPRVRYFPETGHTLRDPFLRYWEEHGGLALFGYPRTEVFDVHGRPVQYFERARFEYWPEFQGTPWEVQLGLLGRYVTRDRHFERQPSPEERKRQEEERRRQEEEQRRQEEEQNTENPEGEEPEEPQEPQEPEEPEPEPDYIYFPETGQYLAHGFKQYWETHGGLAIFGYPISPEIQEVNPADGKTYTVQYFERTRFEWHPEHQGTEFEVELGLLGNQILSETGWYR